MQLLKNSDSSFLIEQLSIPFQTEGGYTFKQENFVDGLPPAEELKPYLEEMKIIDHNTDAPLFNAIWSIGIIHLLPMITVTFNVFDSPRYNQNATIALNTYIRKLFIDQYAIAHDKALFESLKFAAQYTPTIPDLFITAKIPSDPRSYWELKNPNLPKNPSLPPPQKNASCQATPFDGIKNAMGNLLWIFVLLTGLYGKTRLRHISVQYTQAL